MKKFITAIKLAWLFGLSLFIFQGSLSARDAEEDFWRGRDRTQDEVTRTLGPSPRVLTGRSYVDAGLVGYFNFGGVGEDEHTPAFKINAAIKDYFDVVYFRVDGILGLGGPAEGLGEVHLNIIEGLSAGVGLSYTKRLDFSMRFGLYVEDPEDSAKRGGIYIMRDESGGVELSWPLAERWTFNGDFGVEKENDDDFTRLVFGVMYRF